MADLPGRKVWGGREFEPPSPAAMPPKPVVPKHRWEPRFPGVHALVRTTRVVDGRRAAIEVYCPKCDEMLEGVPGAHVICDHLELRWPSGGPPEVKNLEESDMSEASDRLHEAADKALGRHEEAVDLGEPFEGYEEPEYRDPRTMSDHRANSAPSAEDLENRREVVDYLDETFLDGDLRPYQVNLDIPLFEGASVTVLARNVQDAEYRAIHDLDVPIDKVLSVTEVTHASVDQHDPVSALERDGVRVEYDQPEVVELEPLSPLIKATAIGLAVLASVGAGVLGWAARGIYRRRNP